MSDNLRGGTAQMVWIYTVFFAGMCAFAAYLSLFLTPSAKQRLSFLPRSGHVKLFYIGHVNYYELFLVLFCAVAQAVAMYDYYVNRKDRYISRGREFTKEAAFMAACRMFGVGLAINLLFLIPPICKHSFWLELFNVGFERAVRWHRWSGVIVVVLTLLHTILGMASYFEGENLSWCMGWTKVQPEEGGCRERLVWINIYGEIATAAAILIMVTSFETVRRWSYRLFYISHWAFVPFFAFGAVHDRAVLVHALPGIVAYCVDKVLTAGRGRKACTVLKATTDGDSTQLVIATRPGMRIRGAGSWVFINVPKVSALEWHPMSISDLDLNESTLTLDIRHLGKWSNKLGEVVAAADKPPVVRLSGPFGGDPAAEGAVLYVSGGIGLTAHFLAAREAISKANPCKYVGLIWVSPSATLVEAMSDKLDSLRRAGVNVEIYHTGRDDDVEGRSLKQVKSLVNESSKRSGFDGELAQHPAVKGFTNLLSGLGVVGGILYGYEYTSDETRELEFDAVRGYYFFFSVMGAFIGALFPVLVASFYRAFICIPPRSVSNSSRKSDGTRTSTGSNEFSDDGKPNMSSDLVLEGTELPATALPSRVQRGRPDLEAKICEAASRAAALGCSPLDIFVCGPQALAEAAHRIAAPIRLAVHTEPYTF
mmetsp:Transcript_19992/g.50586  ORF Transcript_19992/g.50586 Transcript_19992/m.50586 type:complete len:652 (+) Transcript_19992:256-2211(+)